MVNRCVAKLQGFSHTTYLNHKKRNDENAIIILSYIIDFQLIKMNRHIFKMTTFVSVS